MKVFTNTKTPLVKLDLTFEAGSRYQSQLSVSHAASRLIGEATMQRTSAEVAEFLDFRGIVVERTADVCTACLSFYFLRRYAEELLPLVRGMVEQPLLTPTLFDAYVSKRRQQLEENNRKTSLVARNLWYQTLFGPVHPLGVYATPDDVLRLTPDIVTDFWRNHYRLAEAEITIAGNVDDTLLALLEAYLPLCGSNPPDNPLLPPSENTAPAFSAPMVVTVPSARQASLRVGRILPFRWDDPDCFRFMILNTLLGGYFGSRLMSNLREDKGYTYGINSRFQFFRGCIIFFITADVAPEAVTDSLVQNDAEIRRLHDEPVSPDELRRVCTYLRGDHLRSIDGIFELSERHRQLSTTAIDDRFFDFFLSALDTTTPHDICRLARLYLSPSDLLHVVAVPDPQKVGKG